jgi:hypothetical protein
MPKLICTTLSLGLLMVCGNAVAVTQQKTNTQKDLSYKAEKKIDEVSIFSQALPVFTSPYLGIRSAFDGSDLIVNISTMNEDLRFLEEQQKLNKALHEKNLPALDRPLVEVSGDVVGQAFLERSYHRDAADDINLTGARFDVFSRVSPWAMGYISTDFDNSPLDDSLRGAGFRLGNSRIFLKRAFLTIGNLDEAPLYFSLGQMYVPFGRYSTSMLTTPVTVALGQTNTRAALLGASLEGFFVSVYAFRGDSNIESNHINQWGFNGGYKFTYKDFKVELGGGGIGNLADSGGMQLTGNSATNEFSGFGESVKTEKLDHRVPGYDLHCEIDYGQFGIDTEYISATRHFAFEDMFFNSHGAKPTAFHLEANYRFSVLERPTSFALAYEHTSEALALRLPKDSLVATVNTSIWKNTIESIEYRYDQNYDATDVSGGQAVVTEDGVINHHPVEAGSVVVAPGPVGGGHRNLILAQIGVYF